MNQQDPQTLVQNSSDLSEDNSTPDTPSTAPRGIIACARTRLVGAMDAGKAGLNTLREGSVDSAKAASRMVHLHPFGLVGASFCVGGLLGFLLISRK